MPELSIAIPCYNESKNIPVLVQRFSAFRRNFELILVNNGSTDNSAAVLRGLKKYKFLRVVTVKKNRGYGHGIITGLRAARGRAVAYTHADLQCNPADVFRAYELYRRLGENYMVKGVRIHRKMSQAMFARCLDIVASIVMRMHFYDINAQPKVFSRKILELFGDAPDGYYFDIYIVAKLKKAGIVIREIPVIFERRLHGTSSWQTNALTRARTIKRLFFGCLEVRKSLARMD